jgi:hypothetical protein
MAARMTSSRDFRNLGFVFSQQEKAMRFAMAVQRTRRRRITRKERRR